MEPPPPPDAVVLRRLNRRLARAEQGGGPSGAPPCAAAVSLAARAPPPPSALVVFLHGLHDEARSWAECCRALAPPHAAAVLPQAPANGAWWRGWCTGGGEEVAANCETSARRVAEVARAEAERLGLGRRRVVIAGFSQGGALALRAAASAGPSLVAGVLVLSGYDLAAPPLAFEGRPPAVAWFHGEKDRVVPAAEARKACAALKARGVEVALTTCPHTSHQLAPGTLEAARAWLAEVLPAASAPAA